MQINKIVFNEKTFDESNDINLILGYQERVIKAIVKKDDENTRQVIKDYFIEKYPKENLRFDFMDEETVNKIIMFGVAEYQRRQKLRGGLE